LGEKNVNLYNYENLHFHLLLRSYLTNKYGWFCQKKTFHPAEKMPWFQLDAENVDAGLKGTGHIYYNGLLNKIS